MNKILQAHRWKIHGIPGPKNKNKKPNQQFITLATDSNSDLFLNLKGVIHKNNPEFINSPGPSVQSPGPSIRPACWEQQAMVEEMSDSD